MNQQSDIVEKVRRLLALSKSSNIHEAATAASVAHKYIVKYRLQESDLIDKEVLLLFAKQCYYAIHCFQPPPRSDPTTALFDTLGYTDHFQEFVTEIMSS